MSAGGAKRKLTTVLAADVVGYSGMVAADDEATVGRLRRYREIIEGLVARHEGRAFGAAGDSLMAEFPSAVEAVRCALEIQEEIAAHNAQAPAGQAMRFRIGVNVGEAIVEGENLYGDGVNIAARLQAMADPGGVILSGSAYEQIKNKISAEIEPAGTHSLKNIPEPVAVFRVRVGAPARPAAARAIPWQRRAIAAAFAVVVLAGGFVVWDVFIEREAQLRAFAAEAAQPVPKEPSIAVLPFVNASGNGGQDYFCDGVTEDITTDLTKVSGLFVVGRDSAFSYKGKATSAKHVGRELGVRYVLQGSVRRAEDKVRISAYLVDAATDRTLWAARHDRTLGDVFALQDEIAENVVRAVAVSFRPGERENIRQYALAPRPQPSAYDLFLQARSKLIPPSLPNLREARNLFQRVVEQDERFAGGHAGLSLTYSLAVRAGYSTSPAADVEAALQHAKVAVERDGRNGMALYAMASAWLQRGDAAQALSFAKSAQNQQPGDATYNGMLGLVLTFAGYAGEAISPIERAISIERGATHKLPFHFLKLFAAYTAAGAGNENRSYVIANHAYEDLRQAGVDCARTCLAYAAATKLRLADAHTASDERARLTDEAAVLADRLMKEDPRYLERFGAWKRLFANREDGERIERDVKRAFDLARSQSTPKSSP